MTTPYGTIKSLLDGAYDRHAFISTADFFNKLEDREVWAVRFAHLNHFIMKEGGFLSWLKEVDGQMASSVNIMTNAMSEINSPTTQMASHILQDFKKLVDDNPIYGYVEEEKAQDLRLQISRLNEMYASVRIQLMEEVDEWLRLKVN